jgi:23S rRNA A2030 N6-methylase RlmJ
MAEMEARGLTPERGYLVMDEIYEPKKGFEDVFAALLDEYKREVHRTLVMIIKQGQRSDETLTAWTARKQADIEACLEPLAVKYKPLIRALSDSVTEITKVNEAPSPKPGAHDSH